MKFIRTENFKKNFKGLSKESQKITEGKLRLLENNIRHPSLGIKKVKGRKDVFEGRINKNFRFLFTITADTITLHHVGTHDILKKN